MPDANDFFTSDDWAAILAALIVQEASFKRAVKSASSKVVADAYESELQYVVRLMSNVRRFIN